MRAYTLATCVANMMRVSHEDYYSQGSKKLQLMLNYTRKVMYLQHASTRSDVVVPLGRVTPMSSFEGDFECLRYLFRSTWKVKVLLYGHSVHGRVSLHMYMTCIFAYVYIYVCIVQTHKYKS